MKRWWQKINAGSDWLAIKLAALFGLVWTVWVFFIVPLIAPFFPASVQAKVFYYGSGWVQLFALPLLTLIGNKTQKIADEAQHAQQQMLARNTELTEEVRAVVRENQRLAMTIEHLTQALASKDEHD